ncbi:MAG: hypothetical protein IPI73_24630, partial [Betaproteobacteria bacterium]|nr:hypothetical protein [Betaproteobacteria bacterium]
MTLKDAPEFRFRITTTDLPGGKSKDALFLDGVAERLFRSLFRSQFNDRVGLTGEEFAGTDFSEDKVYALVDMIDGTDLLEMGLPLWGSAIIFYAPRRKEILASVIGLGTGEIYFATQEESKLVRVYRNPADVQNSCVAEKVGGHSGIKSLQEARYASMVRKAKLSPICCLNLEHDANHFLARL